MDMEGSSGGSSTGVIGQLLEKPYEFDFVQAVRLLELRRRQTDPDRPGVGGRGPFAEEQVHFKAMPSLLFPSGEIDTIKRPGRSDGHRPVAGRTIANQWQMIVSFMGLTGPHGVLPRHYTSLLIERGSPRWKDFALREFFDLFNHRAISLFYLACRKYQLAVRYEEARVQQLDPQATGLTDDLITRSLFSLVGLGTGGLRRRLPFNDELLVAFGGLLAQRTRTVVGLEQAVCGCFGVTAKIRQFVGQWLRLPRDLQSALPGCDYPQGHNLQLGESAVVGSRVWDVQSCVCVQLGPVGAAEFDRLLPGTPWFEKIVSFIRFYLGPEKDFQVQLILRKQEVPDCCLGPQAARPALLGHNTWLPQNNRTADAGDAAFRFFEPAAISRT